MRLNPFSQGAGRRRAAMFRGDAPADDAPVAETESRPDETPPAPNAPAPTKRDAGEPADDAKRFGFASRETQGWNEGAVEPEADRAAPPTIQDDRHHGQAAAGAMDGPRPEGEVPAPNPPVQRRPAAAASAQEPPVVSTPHIERLREEIGAEAAEAIEPWLTDELEVPA
ncbi:MAG: hypothetical protein OEU92_20845, partial [Alphaproteobacteria bacterium]|nr:hypothetical protein [Alphaproteobacteria bacterium]